MYFAVYYCGLATRPEAAETLAAQRYLLDYTPETAQFQRPTLAQVPPPKANLWAIYRVLTMCDLRAFALLSQQLYNKEIIPPRNKCHDSFSCT